MIDPLAEYLRSTRTSTQSEIDAQARVRDCHDLTPDERMAQSTQRTFYGESSH
jgi:hypothetical protein